MTSSGVKKRKRTQHSNGVNAEATSGKRSRGNQDAQGASLPAPRSESESTASSESDTDELVYTKTLAELSPSANEFDEVEDANDEEQPQGETVEADFDLYDPCPEHYHGVRHFVVESVLPGLVSKATTRVRKPRHLKSSHEPLEDEDSPSDRHSMKDTATQEENDEEVDDGSIAAATRPVSTTTTSSPPAVEDHGSVTTVVAAMAAAASSLPPLASRLSDCICNQYETEGLNAIRVALLNHARRRLPPKDFRRFEQFVTLHEARAMSSNKLRMLKKRGVVLGSAGQSVVGLFLSERILNMPHDVAPAMLKSLRKDVAWSQETPECPDDERPFYYFTHLIGISRCYVLPARTQATKSDTVNNEWQPGSGSDHGRLGFPKFEDEYFLKHSELHFTIPTNLTSRIPDAEGAKLIDAPEHKLVFVLSFAKLRDVIRDCRAALRVDHGS